jgi:D-alanyl-D-alanine carboxypeptidase/D-alanyl-D-alanine-endopeptidase (penicillin-binding protein 4)
MKRALAVVLSLAFATSVNAAPHKRSPAKAKGKTKAVAAATHARVSYGKELRPAREVVGRREEPLTLEEQTAKQIEKLLRGPLRNGVTGLFVADARSGEPLFAVNAQDELNPASNVKMISTATALELLGPSFKYTTRVMGSEPDATGKIAGDVFLLGTWDPTLAASDMDELAEAIAKRGVKQITGDILVGSDPTRDGIYRGMVPIEIKAGDPGQPPTATTPANFNLITVEVTAKTDKKKRKRQKLTYKTESITVDGKKRIKLTIGGTMSKGSSKLYSLYTRDRTAVAAHSLRAALISHGVSVGGDMRVMELGDFIGESVKTHALPIELARHESLELQAIVRKVNKRSINWLADRVIMTAAALAKRTVPSMDVAVAAMYEWLQRHSQLDRDDVTIDTGSGLSYRTRISPQELVKVVRAAGGFIDGSDATQSKAWLDSLSIAGTDGTLRGRFRVSDIKGHIHGKTGSLSTVIALSGVLDLDPTRPLVFSIVTNTQRPLRKAYVRKAHEQLVALIAKYIESTSKPTSLPATSPVHFGTPKVVAPQVPETTEAEEKEAEAAEAQPDPELDVETATSK